MASCKAGIFSFFSLYYYVLYRNDKENTGGGVKDIRKILWGGGGTILEFIYIFFLTPKFETPLSYCLFLTHFLNILVMVTLYFLNLHIFISNEAKAYISSIPFI